MFGSQLFDHLQGAVFHA